MEEKLDLAVAEIKAWINGITLQNNEIRRQMVNKDNGSNMWSMMGAVNGEVQAINGELQAPMVLSNGNLRTIQAVYSVAPLQDTLKNDPSIPGTVASKGGSYKFNGGQSLSAAPKLPVVAVQTSGGQPTKGNFPDFPGLNLTSKQLEKEKLKNPKQLHGIFHVSRLKRLMVLIGTSFHCLCLMICLQLWNEKTKYLLIFWFSGRTFGRLFLKFTNAIFLFPLRTRVLRGGVVVMKKW